MVENRIHLTLVFFVFLNVLVCFLFFEWKVYEIDFFAFFFGAVPFISITISFFIPQECKCVAKIKIKIKKGCGVFFLVCVFFFFFLPSGGGEYCIIRCLFCE